MLRTLIVLALLISITGCTYPFPPGGPGAGPSLEEVRGEFASNGEMIYFTGYNEVGQAVPRTGGPGWLSMHGGGCVTCHGQDGRGGEVPHMCTEAAPDISYHALTEEEHGEHAEEGEEPHPPYTEETIGRAIREGLNPAGESLDPCMPRWGMSDNDLADVIDYLRTLEGTGNN